MAKDKCVLAYSGGLDTSVCIKWLQDEKNLDVIAVVGEVGQEHEGLEQVKQRALETGAIDCIIADMREDSVGFRSFSSADLQVLGRYRS